MPSPGRREAIFLAALEREPAHRAAYLADACRGDAELRTKVERLLTAVDRADRRLATLEDKIAGLAPEILAAATSVYAAAEAPLPAGTRLGPWRLLAPIGGGGMGRVYRAERADGAFEMQAAVKLIRGRHPDLEERLAEERRLLARLDHPGITRLLDGGTTPDGRTYLVMEWVPGTDLADADLDAEEQLATFLQIAAAVTHAHQRRVVHGDIKPTNVRLMPDGRARLLDFGIARMLVEGAEERDTHRGMTPAFAAPEQLAGQPTTTQTDVWALGALLAWMLTDELPAQDLALQPSQLERPRARDLVAIVERAMARDPGKRYATVAALEEDVRRIVIGEPVQAARTGVARRLSLWVRRRRLAAALGALALASALTGAVAVAWQVRVALAERDAARFEYERFHVLRDRLVEMFAEGVEATEEGGEPTARELLDRVAGGAERSTGDAVGDAAWRALLGEIYIALDDTPSAKPLLESVVQADADVVSTRQRARALTGLAAVLHREGDAEAALARVDAALELYRVLPGDLRLRRSEAHQIRGRVLRSLGRLPDAIGELQTAFELARQAGESSRLLASTENNLAVTLLYAGRSEDALEHFRGALRTFRRLGAGDSSEALVAQGNLASILFRLGLAQEAEPLFEQAIASRRTRFGDSAALGALYTSHGQLLAMRHRLDEARNHLERAVELFTRFAGPTTPGYAVALRSLAELEAVEGDRESAAARFAKAEAILETALGPEHPFTVVTHADRAALLRHTDDEAAVPAFAEAIPRLAAAGSATETALATALCEQALLFLARSEPRRALAPARRCRRIRRATLPAGAWQQAHAEAVLAAVETRLGDETAAARLGSSLVTLGETYGPRHPRLEELEAFLRPPIDDASSATQGSTASGPTPTT